MEIFPSKLHHTDGEAEYVLTPCEDGEADSETPPCKNWKRECEIPLEDYETLAKTPYVLDKTPVPLFFAPGAPGVHTIGGFEDPGKDQYYVTCPCCGKPMKYLACLDYNEAVFHGEGVFYIEVCPDCQIVSTHVSWW